MKTILFDHDGTLINSLDAIVSATNRTLNAWGLADRSRVEVLSGIPYPTETRLSLLTGEEDPETLHKMTNDFYRLYDEDVVEMAFPYPEIPGLLKRLYNNGKRMGVVSNCRGRIIRKVLTHNHLSVYFPLILGEEELLIPKPHPQGLLQGAAALGERAEDCWYIGDGPPDFEAARSAGMRSGMVTWGILTRDQIETLAPDKIFDTPEELTAFFLKE